MLGKTVMSTGRDNEAAEKTLSVSRERQWACWDEVSLNLCLSENRKFRLKVKWGKKDGLPTRMLGRKSKLSQDVLEYILKDVLRGNLRVWVKFHQKLKFWKRTENFCCIWTKSAFLKTFCLVRVWITLSPQRVLSTAFLDLFFVTLCSFMPNRFMWFFWFVLHVQQKEHHFFYFACFSILIWIQT
jgi:hypothetical protein